MHPALIVVKKSTATACLITPGYGTECLFTGKYSLTGYISSIINTFNKYFFNKTKRWLSLVGAPCNNITHNAYQQSTINNNPNDQPIKKQGV
jgi:hypothetical protein